MMPIFLQAFAHVMSDTPLIVILNEAKKVSLRNFKLSVITYLTFILILFFY